MDTSPPCEVRAQRFASRRIVACGYVIFGLLAAGVPLAGQTIWTGGGADNNWGTAANWNATVSNPSAVVLHFAGSTRLTPNVNTTWTTAGIQFDSGAGAFVIGGSALTLSSASGIVNASSNTETINNAITLSAAQTWQTSAGNLVIGGAVSGGSNLTKDGTGSVLLTASNSLSGNIIVSAGTLQLSGASGATTAAAPYVLNGGTLTIDNTTAAGGNNNARISDTSTIALNGGSFVYKGADAAATPSTETVGAISGTGNSTLTVTFGGTNRAVLTGASLTHTAGNGSILVNGTSLGKDSASTTSVGRVILTTAPTLVGSTNATTTGINSGAKNTKIVPFLVGEATSTTGGLGTQTGTANTFLTYNATTGLRALNPTDEFTNNAITSGNNTRITSATSAGSTASINSLIIAGGNLTIGTATARTLTDTSGALLFTSSNSILTGSNTASALAFGTTEAMITVNNGVTGTIGAVVTGSGAVTKSGSGTLLLSGANTYTGATNVTAGILSISNNTALGTTAGGVTVGSGGSLELQNNITVGSEALSLNGTGSASNGALRNLSGTNTYGGLITLAGPTTIQSDAGSLALSNTGTITGAGFDLTLEGAGNGSIAGIIGTTGGALTKNDAGTWTLSGANTYTGGTTINGGTLTLSGSGKLGNTSGTLTVNGGTLNLNGTAQSVGNLTGTGGSILNNGANQTFTIGTGNTGGGNYQGTIANGTGAIALTKTGTGTITLSGANTYTGATAINGGILSIANNTALGTTAGGVTVASGASLELQNNITVGSEALSLNGVGSSSSGALRNLSGTNTYGGLITLAGPTTIQSDAGSLALSNTGTITGAGFGLTLEGAGNGSIASIIGTTSGALTKNDAGTWTLSGANTYTGGTTINGGTLTLSGSGTLGSTSGLLTMSGGTLNLNGTAQNAGNLTGSSGTILNNNAAGATLTIGNGGNGGGTFSGAITDGTGTVGLTKTGGGTITIAGSNSFTGGTVVNGGTLKLGGTSALGAAGAAVNLNGGTLDLATDTSANAYNVTVGGNAAILSDKATPNSAGITHTLGTLSIGGQTLSVAAGGNVTANSPFGLTFGATTLTGAGTTSTFDVANNGSGTGALILGALSGNGNTLAKQGAGTLELDTASTRSSGGTILTAGTLKLGSTSALGTTGTTLTLNGGTLDLATDSSVNAYNTTVAGNVTIQSDRATSGTPTQTLGTLSIGGQTLSVAPGANAAANSNYSLTFGATTLNGTGATTTFDVANNGSGTGTLTLGALGAAAGANDNLVKQGAGTLALNSAGSRDSGSTTLTAGTLQVSNANALSTNASGSLFLNGGTLQLSNSTGTTFNGTAITVGGDATILSDRTAASQGTGRTHSVTSLAIGSNNLTVTPGPNVNTGTAGLTVTGATQLSGTPTFTVNNGSFAQTLTLNALDDGFANVALGHTPVTLTKAGNGVLAIASDATSLIDGTAVNVTNGTLNSNSGAALGALANVTVSPGATFGVGANQAIGALNGVSGATVALGSRTLTVGSTTNNLASSFAGTITGTGDVTKAGSGTFTLSGNTNSYTGTTTINGGTLLIDNLAVGGVASSIGASGTSAGNLVIDGGTLAVSNALAQSSNRSFSIGANGATLEARGASTAISFTGTGSYALTGGTGVARSVVLTGDGTGSLSGRINNDSGGGVASVTKNGTGTWTLGGSSSNTFTGPLTINSGTVILAKSSGAALSGDAVIGDGSGTDTLQAAGNSQFNSSGTVTFFGTTGTPTLDLNGTTQTIGGISSNNANAAILLGSPGAATTVTVGGNNADTTFIGTISGGANAGLAKSGTGTLTLASQNTFDGALTISAGTLKLGAGTNLANNTPLGSAVGGTTVSATGGALDLNGFSITNSEALALKGTGVGTTGALTNTGAAATFGGPVTLTSAASIGGTGDITLTSGLVGNVTLTKTGANTLNLNAASTRTGATQIDSGTIRVGDAAALSAAGNLTLNGGTLDIAVDGSISAHNTTVSATSTILSGAATAAAGDFTHTLGTLNMTSDSTLNIGVGSNANGHIAGVEFGTTTLGTGPTNTYAFNVASGASLKLASVNGSGRNFSLLGGGDMSVTGAVTTGAGTVTMNGSGTLTLNGNNTYDGLTTVNSGTLALNGSNTGATGGVTVNGGLLNLGNNNAVGSASGTLTLNGGTVAASGGARTINNPVSLAASSTIGGGNDLTFSGALTNTSGGNPKLTVNNSGATTFSNTVALSNSASDNTLTVGGTGNTTFSGVISNGAGGSTASGFTKSDAGTVTFSGSGANTYGGTTTVNGGTLVLSKTGGALAVNGPLAIGDNSAAGTVQLGAANQINSASAVTFGTTGAPTLNLNGFAQTLNSVATSNTNAVIAFGSPGATTNFTVGDATSPTYAGKFTSGNSNAGIVKQGTGNLTLSGDNSGFTGAIQVTNGTLTAQGNNSLGASATTTTVNSGATLALGGGTAITHSGMLTLNGTGYGAAGALMPAGGSGTTSSYLGSITLGSDTTITAANNLLIVGDGTAFTSTLNLGGHTLTFNTTAAPTVTPTYNPFPFYALDPSNILVNSAISNGGIIKTGTGTLNLMPVASGGSTFTGDTVILGGKVIVDSQPNMPGINSNQIYIGNAGSSGGPGVADTVVLQMGQAASSPAANNMIGTWNSTTNASTSNLTIYADGVFNMNDGSNGFANLTLQGGHVYGGGIHNPLLTLTGGITTNASSQTALINSGNLGLSAASAFSINVAQGTTASGIDLQIDDIVQNGVGYTGGGSGTNLQKDGAGKLVLTGSNTYSGITNVTTGILNIQNGQALGQSGSFIGDTANGTVVQSGAQLQLQNNITIGSESITLNGTGIGANNDGALRNLGGANTLNGQVYLASDARINADSGTTLTIQNTNNINATIINGTAAGKNLTVGGDGDTVVKGGIAAFVNNVTKDGNGTLTLAGQDGYAGTLNVNAGAVKLTNSNALSGTGAVVSSGAALQFAQDGNSNDITEIAFAGGAAATINGTGLSGHGAIQNLNGNNTYLGNIALGAVAGGAPLIAAESGSSLTLGGSITNTAGNALTIGGAGDIKISGATTIGTVNTALDVNGHMSITSVGSAGALTKTDSGTLTFQGGVTHQLGGISLNQGKVNVSGTGTFVLTGPLASSAGTTLTIDSGNKVQAFYGASTTTTFSGAMAGAGTFQKDGAGTLVFDQSFSAGNLTLVLNGGILALANAAQVEFGTIHFTGDTVLDFGSSTATLLKSATLIIDQGVTITVNNWTSYSDAWLVTTSFYQADPATGLATVSATHDQRGFTPENQITFSGRPASWTSWVTPQGSYGYFNNEIRPTPEPATYGVIFFSASLGLFGLRRYLRRKAAQRSAS